MSGFGVMRFISDDDVTSGDELTVDAIEDDVEVSEVDEKIRKIHLGVTVLSN